MNYVKANCTNNGDSLIMKNIENHLEKHHRKKEADAVKELIEYISDFQYLMPSIKKEAYTSALSIQRKSKRKLRVENLMNMYPLYSDRGRNMMALSEALLRIPDKGNQGKLVIEKVKHSNWIVSYTYGFALFLASNLINFATKLLPKNDKSYLGRFITPVARAVSKFIIQSTSYQFILAQEIGLALKKSNSLINRGYSFSYDMLGESAKTEHDAMHYFKQYMEAIEETGKFSKTLKDPTSVSVSIKLSSLHARYEVSQYGRFKSVIYGRLLDLCKLAAKYDLLLFIDAEEAERLILSLDMIEDLLKEKELINWCGLGLALQCYQKRGFFVIDEIAKMAKENNKKIYVRLVKGAYWDAEIKNDQVNGVQDFALFTRKEHTDIAYMACAKKMSLYDKEIYPCFATHNAFSIAYIRAIMGNKQYEFQCLQGMGDIVYDRLVEDKNNIIKVRKYAPVGKFNTLLPYLVRRLIENGARSSFINQVLSNNADIEKIVENPVVVSNKLGNSRHELIKLPRDIFAQEHRINSKGEDMSQLKILKELEETIRNSFKNQYEVSSIINGVDIKGGEKEEIINPANLSDNIGVVYRSSTKEMLEALNGAYEYFPIWNNTAVGDRVKIINKIASALEEQSRDFVALLVREAGKTIRDSILEVREAVDFLRYYSVRAIEEFSSEIVLPGPIGEKNTLKLEGRGVFLCIAPWNFPLAIFIGQIAAALVAGNTAVAKSAESTSAIGYKCIKMMLECGLPGGAVQFLPAKGKLIGETLLGNNKLGGVVFTGSDITAKSINRSIANREGAIIPLIAETGGQNAMIVDSTALIEQVTRDVLSSGFQSAGQRCSALRVLFVQEEIADSLIEMIAKAMDLLKIGDPAKMDCDVGPVINMIALSKLNNHLGSLSSKGRLINKLSVSKDLNGYYFAPVLYEINSIRDLKSEVFGPVVHVVRYKLNDLEKLIAEINSTGYGLTFAIHSRLDSNIKMFSSLIRAGNIYINRNQIGAVVSSQPFGGMGNSGTGPKAGGPLYLHKFAVEKTISLDLNATGGDVEIMSKV